MIDDYLEHVGIIGMHWGKRKARKAEKKTNDNIRRVAVIERMRKKDPYIDIEIMNDRINYGKKITNKVLDKMAKDPLREYNSTINTEYTKHVVKRALLIMGATVIGTGLSQIR